MAVKNTVNPPTCPIDRVIDVIGGKWAILILAQLLDNGVMRFGELSRALPGISVRTLTLRLQELETHNLVKRKVYSQIPPKVEYSLTPAGHKIQSVFDELQRFGDAAGL